MLLEKYGRYHYYILIKGADYHQRIKDPTLEPAYHHDHRNSQRVERMISNLKEILKSNDDEDDESLHQIVLPWDQQPGRQ